MNKDEHNSPSNKMEEICITETYFLAFLSKYRPLSSEQGKFYIILVNCVKCSHRH